MNPFYFGPSDRPLFGVFSQARTREAALVGSAPEAVLLCYPMAGEYLRAHRAFRQLTNLLSRRGLGVLRFDYSCTGDSSGRGEDARLAEWVDDVDWAVEELKAMVGVEKVSVVGLRFGASIAALAATRRADVEQLVLWDPIVSGSAYVREMVGPTPTDETVGVEGVPLTPELQEEIRNVDLRCLQEFGAGSASIVVAEDGPDHRSLERRLQKLGATTDFEVIPSSGSWTEVDPFGSAYIPERIIQAIVDRFAPPARVGS